MSAVPRIALLTTLAMAAFAGNSVLNRIALASGAIDPVSFGTLRLLSGAAVLALLVFWRTRASSGLTTNGSWSGALSLFVYVLGFSLAYVSLDTGLGALLLFGTVQITMIAASMMRGRRLSPFEWIGTSTAFAALIYLVSPGSDAPPLAYSALMMIAGAGWGAYSLLGAGAKDPLGVTAGNFLRAVPFALAASVFLPHDMHWSANGVILALVSGAITSGLGYAIWYSALPLLGPVRAAVVQLTVPVIAAFGGIALLNETLSLRLVLAAILILGGVGLVFYAHGRKYTPQGTDT